MESFEAKRYNSVYLGLVNLMSPSNILRKGFAILEINGKIISNADSIAEGKDLTVRLIDSTIKTRVISKFKENGK